MKKVNEDQMEVVKYLQGSKLSNYKIAQDTGITEMTIANYRKKKTLPTPANTKILLHFFKPDTPEQVSMSKDVFELIVSQQKTIQMQQELLNKYGKGGASGDATIADVV